MGLFNKLFPDKSKPNNPDNSRLLGLLDTYWKENGKGDSYKNVVLELMNGDSFLMFPTKNDFKTYPNNWTTTEKEMTFKMQSLLNVDGLKVLVAFTDEQGLMTWVKKPTEYTAMRAQDILKFARDNDVSRIIINNDLPNMFVVERDKGDVKEHQIKKDTKIQVGTPDRPLNNLITQKLIDNFKKDKTISEVYQYGQTKDGEFSIVLGFKLTTYSDNAKKAAIYSVQDAIQNQTMPTPLDIFFIETEEWYDRVKDIEKALLYKS